MNDRADLIGAVRLPNSAHQRAAGTEVLTDVLLFRKRHEADAPRNEDWLRSTVQEIPVLRGRTTDGTWGVHVNNYFLDHPEQVLGDFVVTPGVRGSLQLGVQASEWEPLGVPLTDALTRVTDRARANGLTLTSFEPAAPSLDLSATLDEAAARPADPLEEPAPRVDPLGRTHRRSRRRLRPVHRRSAHRLPVAKAPSARRELRSLLEMRDLGTTLLQIEARTQGNDPAVSAQRDQLRAAWESHHQTYGPINRYRESWRTSKTGKQFMVPIYPSATKAFRGDPFAPFVSALEKFDPETQTARPADLLQHRTVARRHIPRAQRTSTTPCRSRWTTTATSTSTRSRGSRLHNR